AANRRAGKTIVLTRPFLEVGYALVAPPAFILRGLDDLDGKTVGVLFASTPQTLLSVRDRVRLTTFKSTEAALDALAAGQIEVAFLWGPEAGYRAAQRGLLGGFGLTSVAGLNLRWRATIGVRAADVSLRDQLDRVLADVAPAIARLAAKYHFPLDTPVDLDVPDPTAQRAAVAAAPPPSKTNPFRGDPSAVVWPDALQHALFALPFTERGEPRATHGPPSARQPLWRAHGRGVLHHRHAGSFHQGHAAVGPGSGRRGHLEDQDVSRIRPTERHQLAGAPRGGTDDDARRGHARAARGVLHEVSQLGALGPRGRDRDPQFHHAQRHHARRPPGATGQGHLVRAQLRHGRPPDRRLRTREP